MGSTTHSAMRCGTDLISDIPVDPRRRRGCSCGTAAKNRRKAGWARGSCAESFAQGAAFGAVLKARKAIWGAIIEAMMGCGGRIIGFCWLSLDALLSLVERHHRLDYLSNHAGTALAGSGNQLSNDVSSSLDYLMPSDNVIDYMSADLVK